MTDVKEEKEVKEEEKEVKKEEKEKDSDIYGDGYGDSHIWKKGQTRNLGSVYNSLRGTHYKCEKCNVRFFHKYNIIRNPFRAIELSGIDNKCSSNPNLAKPAAKRLQELKEEMELTLKPMTDGEYDCLERVRPFLIREIQKDMKEMEEIIQNKE